jgi:hypothetical protein
MPKENHAKTIVTEFFSVDGMASLSETATPAQTQSCRMKLIY